MKRAIVLTVLLVVVLAAWPVYGWVAGSKIGTIYDCGEKYYQWTPCEDTIKAEPQIAWIMVLRWEDGVAVWYGFDEAGRVRMKPYIDVPEKGNDSNITTIGTVSVNLFMWHLQGKAPIWIQHMYVEAMQRIRDKAKPFELKNP